MSHAPLGYYDFRKNIEAGCFCFEEFRERHGDVVKAVAAQVVAEMSPRYDEHEAARLEEVVFSRLSGNGYSMLKAYDRRKCTFFTWLAVVSRGIAQDFARTRFYPQIPLRDIFMAMGVATEHIETELANLDTLFSSTEKMVLCLLYIEKCSEEQAAATLGASAETIRSILTRAMNRLREPLLLFADPDVLH